MDDLGNLALAIFASLTNLANLVLAIFANFANLANLVPAILANFTNLAYLANLILANFANLANLANLASLIVGVLNETSKRFTQESEESSPAKAAGRLAKVNKMADEGDMIVEVEVTIKDLFCAA